MVECPYYGREDNFTGCNAGPTTLTEDDWYDLYCNKLDNYTNCHRFKFQRKKDGATIINKITNLSVPILFLLVIFSILISLDFDVAKDWAWSAALSGIFILWSGLVAWKG